MVYLEPFRGKEAIRRYAVLHWSLSFSTLLRRRSSRAYSGWLAGRSYFEKVVSIVPADLKFAIEDVTENDSRAVGVKWCVVFSLSVILRLIA